MHTGDSRITGNLLPFTDNSVDLGSDTKNYRAIYSRLFTGGNAVDPLVRVTAEELALSGDQIYLSNLISGAVVKLNEFDFSSISFANKNLPKQITSPTTINVFLIFFIS